jgi:putative transposase
VSALITDAIDEAVGDLVEPVGAQAACTALGLPRASYYRARAQPDSEDACAPSELSPSPSVSSPAARQRHRQRQPRALTEPERAAVREVLHSARFIDAAPATIYATLLDEGT